MCGMFRVCMTLQLAIYYIVWRLQACDRVTLGNSSNYPQAEKQVDMSSECQCVISVNFHPAHLRDILQTTYAFCLVAYLYKE